MTGIEVRGVMQLIEVNGGCSGLAQWLQSCDTCAKAFYRTISAHGIPQQYRLTISYHSRVDTMRSTDCTTSQSTNHGDNGKLSWEVTYPLADEQVLRLDVAVDHVLCVAVV
jgi:hypothetical protein